MKPFIYLGSFPIPTYHLVISLTFSLLLFGVVQRAKKRKLSISHTLDLSLTIMIGGFIGARLFHVFYEDPRYYAEQPFRVLEFWRGGFVFYGGVIGAWILTEWLILYRQLDRGKWEDLFAPLFPVGYALGRLGCLAAGCCYGHATDVFWGIEFPPGVEAPPLVLRHPTQVYAFIYEIIVFALIFFIDRKRDFSFLKYGGALFHFWLFFHGIGRIMMEFFRDDHRGAHIVGFSISTWISLALILYALVQFYRGNNPRSENDNLVEDANVS